MKHTQLLFRPVAAVAGFFLAIVLGALTQPLLSGPLGAAGIAYYSLATPVITLLTAAGTMVFPVLIGWRIAPLAERGEMGDVRMVFADHLLALALPGTALGVIFALLAGPIAGLCGLAGGGPALVGVAPLFLLAMAAAALRGFFLGVGNYGYFGLSLLIQQIAKVLLTTLLAGLGRGDPSRMAQWACLGICVAEGLSLLALAVLFGVSGYGKGTHKEEHKAPLAGLAARLWKAGGLAALLAVFGVLLCAVDALVIPGRFDPKVFSRIAAAGGYALLSAFALPMVLFPGLLSACIALLGLGGIFTARQERNRPELAKRAELSAKGALLLSVPAAMTVGILAKPLLGMFFSGALGAEQLQTAAELVQLLAIGLVFCALGTVGAMQLCATGHAGIGAVNAAAALVVKLVLTLLFATQERTVFGGAFATVAALFVFCAGNVVQAARRTGAELRPVQDLVKPALCAICMGPTMYFLYFALLEKLMGFSGAILAALCGYLIYAALAVALRVLNADELSRLPFGPKLYDILNKTGMVK